MQVEASYFFYQDHSATTPSKTLLPIWDWASCWTLVFAFDVIFRRDLLYFKADTSNSPGLSGLLQHQPLPVMGLRMDIGALVKPHL